VTALRSLLPSGVAAVARTLADSGPGPAAAELRRLAAADPPTLDVDDEVFVDAVWGAIELHRTDLVRPLLQLWTDQRPDSSPAWTMTGWAHQVDGDHERGRALLGRALELDPGNEEAATLLGGAERT
jgi:hypothetical protein